MVGSPGNRRGKPCGTRVSAATEKREVDIDDQLPLPYTVLSCCMSMDGYISSATGARLRLSNEMDFDRVDEVRAHCDAILVGAQTVRTDNPRLLVRHGRRVAARRRQGRSASPLKVTVTDTGSLERGAAFFDGRAGKLVYCSSATVDETSAALGGLATVVDGGAPVTMRFVGHDLAARGVRRMMVEGGATLLTQFLADGIADELHLVVAPLFVGDSRARRFVDDAEFPWRPGRRGHLADVQQIQDVALLTYALSERFRAEAVTAPNCSPTRARAHPDGPA
jgi:5-amino-6-(5-phosphoribosylamino)uracil reductase